VGSRGASPAALTTRARRIMHGLDGIIGFHMLMIAAG